MKGRDDLPAFSLWNCDALRRKNTRRAALFHAGLRNAADFILATRFRSVSRRVTKWGWP